MKIFQYLFLFLLSTVAYAQPLKVMLDWELNPDHAPLWVAEHYGFFKQHQLEVTLIPPADPSDPAKFAAAQKVDLALTYEPQWIIQQSQGLPVFWVATLVNQPLAAMLTNTQIHSLSDLKGKTIGYSSGAIDRIFLQTMLRQEHLTLNDVQLVNLHYDLMQALVARKISAMTGAMRNVEPIELQQKNFPFHIFKPEDFGVPSYAELIFVSGKTHDPRFPSFILALQEGVKYLKQHPEETWQAFAKENPALSDEANHQIWLHSVQYFTDQPGKFDEAQYEKLKAFLNLGLKNE